MSKDSFVLSAGQSHEIELAMNRPGNGKWTPELVHLLSKGTVLGQVRQVLMSCASITMTAGTINCDIGPFVPDGLAVAEHLPGRMFQWDDTKVELWLANNQLDRSLKGTVLRNVLLDYSVRSGKLLLNANVLDYLLSHSDLIPWEWKAKRVFFWGTIYRNREGHLCVRGLHHHEDNWGWGYRLWNDDFSYLDPVALRVI